MEKREKIRRSYEHYKRQITHWESAIIKNTGRKPNKNDLSEAPASVQAAYKEYRKIKKYLESNSFEEKQLLTEENKQKTPKKIFFRYQGHPSHSAETSLPDAYKKLSSKIFMASSLTNSVLDKPFSGNSSSSSKVTETCELPEKISVPQGTIIPSRIFSMTTIEDSGQDLVDGSFVNEKKSLISNKSFDGISALWQNPSLEMKTTNLLGKNGEQTKQVDSSWLERCGADFDIDNNVGDNVSNVIMTPVKCSPKNQSKTFLQNIMPETQTLAQQSNHADFADRKQELQIASMRLDGCDAEVNVSNDTLDNGENDNVTNIINTRKRTSAVAFSPSPEKPKPKRKFFKTTGEERNKNRIIVPANVINKVVPNTVEVRGSVVKKNTSNSNSDVNIKRKESITESISKTTKRTSPMAFSPSPENPKLKQKKVFKKTMEEKSTRNRNIARVGVIKKVVTDGVKRLCSDVSGTESKDDNNSNPKVNIIQRQRTSTLEFSPSPEKQNIIPKRAAFKTGRGKRDVNDNFLRIDVSKKVFVRGHKKVSGAKVKRMNWKSKQSAAFKATKSATLTCRKCGETGHFAKFCSKGLNSNEKQEPEQIDDSPFPTLEEAAKMAISKTASNVISTKVYDNSYPSTWADSVNEAVKIPNEATSTQSEFEFEEHTKLSDSQSINTVSPYFDEHISPDEQDELLQKTLNIFGYNAFRDGQKEAIVRVLNGLSTLVILSTGSGKSLCYQLPAYLYSKKYPGVLTLCISPLVSLMEDQVQGVPSFFNAACLHNNMSAKNKEIVIEKLKSKALEVLLVSPEAICGGLFGLLKTGNIPPIGFACIDEVHCVSQWSHNFRPSYLQIFKILREKLNVQTILGLTATATDQTAVSICEHIKIDPSTTIRGELIPRNLCLSVSRDKDRDEALLILLKGERFKECDSIIIYCTRREQCETIAKFIRIKLQEGAFGLPKGKTRQKISNNCEAYHAGMTPTRRRMVQRLFMNGEIRIVVATVAFGMGIDKSDIRAVIHYNMPKTFESYVQEIGRAGRDGLPAHCHLFLDNIKGRDLCELKRHVFSNSVDRPTLRKLISRIFKPCTCSRIAEITGDNKENKSKDNNGIERCPGHEVSFSVNDTVMEVDLPQENIMTLLCYLELDNQRKWIELLPMTYELCKIQSYGGAQLLKSSAQACPPLAVAIALKRENKKFKDKDTYLEFNVIEAAATVGWSSAIVKRELKNLEWKATEFDEIGNGKKFRKSGILVEFSELAFRVVAPGDINDEEADIILNSLHKINLEQEQTQLNQLNRVYQSLFSVSSSNVGDCCDGYISEKSDRLKDFIHDYFQRSKSDLSVPEKAVNEPPQGAGQEEEVRRDVRNLIFSSQDTKFTGRAIAKIFHGISSPCFPAEHWGRNRAFWRRYLGVDFNFLCQIAGQEVLMHQ